jgi:four helix bundle protein
MDEERKSAQSFQDLKVWQKAHQLVLEVYKVTRSFPAEERFGLVSQMRRAAVSIPANIAEGFARRGIKDKLNFYNISNSSLEELKYYLILSEDLKYLPSKERIWLEAEEVGRMLASWSEPLRSK